MRNAGGRATGDRAYIVTGPTAGIGREAALAIAEHGTVVLVGRDRGRLEATQRTIEERGGQAVTVRCDLSDLASVERAAAEMAALPLNIVGLLNNAGIFPHQASRSAQGFDLAYATNHLGPFALTEALLPRLPDGARVVFVVSADEDPERWLAHKAGLRGARFISVAASARGQWQPGGSKLPGADAYATSKQGSLVTALALARETPRLRFSAVEPGFSPSSELGRGGSAVERFLMKRVLGPLAPFIKHMSTPQIAGRMIAKLLVDESATTGVYYDEKGRPMRGSAQAHDPKFQDRVVAQTRALLATVPTSS